MSVLTLNPAEREAAGQSYDELIVEIILGDAGFVDATFQSKQPASGLPWQTVTVRPVLIRDSHHFQFVYFDGVQTRTRNFRDAEAEEPLRALFVMPLRSIRARTLSENLQVQFSKKGRPIVHRDRHRSQPIPLDLAHDRTKPGIISDKDPPAFLGAIGMLAGDGRIKSGHVRKFRQINEFLRLVEETGIIDEMASRAIRVVDLGCGSAALTFSMYHYLNTIKGVPAEVIGIDAKSFLITRHREAAAHLGWEGLSFHPGLILDFETAELPDIVMALHACDTATDEAIARGIRWQSKLILSAPCCHHNLQAQLAAATTPDVFRPVQRHGILQERLGDILTDSFRALILRLLGYRTDVVEFVAADHTPKNLMIRGIRTDSAATAALAREYMAMKSFWGVTPYLEELLAEELQTALQQ